jgi:preprotein translocase subunit SecG
MTILFVIQIIVVVMMIGVILMQKTSSDGLMSGSNPDSFLTGRASANVLSRTTAILATIFIVNSLVMGYLVSHTKRTESVIDEVFANKTEAPKTDAATPVEGSSTPADPATSNEAAPAATPATNTEKPAEQKPASVPAAD